MNSFKIRQTFLDFFAQKGHTIVPSSSLIPAEDPTLLFANAGMNQFKDLFLGKERRSYTRATTSQKCVRAGGKHNDLDQVGFTERHLTFFEMLGNFSFGDYFKKEAIAFAWEFLTKEVRIPAEKLYVTIYKTDDESFEIWHKHIGLPECRITRLGEKDNFWQMGDTGPCGPCTEIYIDRGIAKGCQQPHCAPGCDCARFMEIWNNVFMQYDRQTNGALEPLKQTGVDTGMGLERLAVVLQGVATVFDTDLFTAIMKKTEQLTGVAYAESNDQIKAAFRVIADHVRSSSLLIADGCSPSNDGRGYVLRKIIRRAALFAQKLSSDQKLLSKIAQDFIEFLSPVYPELKTNQKLIISVLDCEIERFTNNLAQGQIIFEKYCKENKSEGRTFLTGQQVFKLYDTYGFPPELTTVLTRENNMTLDYAGFEEEMKKQQEQSGKKKVAGEANLSIPDGVKTTFVGYETLECVTKIQHLTTDFQEGISWIVTEESPFYVECGGQISDAGWVTIKNQDYPVLDLKKCGMAIAAKVALCDVQEGETVRCVVEPCARQCAVKNHTAAHLLQAALVQVLGPQVKQAGSQVTASSLRFDFSHHQAMTTEQIEQVELLVNQKIQEDLKTEIFSSTLEEAKRAGALAFFGEKYNPECVRVVQIPGFSVELCGGTHAVSTGVIGCFKIISETALATGTRRIVAVTGCEALTLFQKTYTTIKKLGEEFKAKPDEVFAAVKKLQQTHQDLLLEVRNLKKQLIRANIMGYVQKMVTIATVPFLYLEQENMSIEDLKTVCQELEKTAPGFYFMVSKNTEACSSAFIGYVSKQLEGRVNAKKCFDVIKLTCPEVRGGGSPTMIQGNGTLGVDMEALICAWLKGNA